MSKYKELLDKFSSYHCNGIFYAFSEEQFELGMKICGYDKNTKLVQDGMGGYGTKEAFDERHEFFNAVEEEIRQKCTPDEVFEFEYWNHECGYTYDYSEALEITRSYFPDYTPSRAFLGELEEKSC